MLQAIGGAPPTRIDPPVAGPATTSQSLSPPASDQASAPATSTDTSSPSGPTRVVVEPGQDKFVLVFKVLDSATGNILAEIPNQSPQQAAKNPAYVSGSLINQKV